LALGLSRGAIDHAIARGRLRRIHRGVYAVGHVALPAFAAEMAAVLAVGHGAVLSHQSAAVLWKLIPHTSNEPQGSHEPEIHVTVVGRDAGRRRAGIRVHRAAMLAAQDMTVLHGIPITTPARTLYDTAACLSAREYERAFDEALTRRLVSRRAVVALLERSPRDRGIDRLEQLAGAQHRASTLTRSDTEERLLTLIRRGGLAVPEINAQIGQFIVDFLWRRPRLIVEVDGYAFHSSHRAFENDHKRDLELGAAGFQVMRFTWKQIVDEPELVLTRLAQRLTELSSRRG
jgi:very-short-patch-repair endonuclease